MANVHDVAAYILGSLGPMTAMKLQKLVYYAQAWHLVWDEEPLFPEQIQAWANGPVVYELYDQHRGSFRVESWPAGDPAKLSKSEKGSIDAVVAAYGEYTAQQLSEMTHREEPWKSARAGLPDGTRSNRTISIEAMHEYYHGLAPS